MLFIFLDCKILATTAVLIHVEVTIDSNKVIETLFNYQKYKFRFIIESLLFITNLQNNTDVIFITSNSLTEAKTALINSK